MIISRTPFRISFFGGGTDYPSFYCDNGGAVLASAITRYCYITLRKLPSFFDYTHRIVYSKAEHVNNIQDIVHPSVRECLRYMDIHDGLEVHHDGDLPARAGIGSSSAFTVGLLHALHAYAGRMISKLELAEAAIHVEQDLIQEAVGSQDQTLAAFGGINMVRFDSPDRDHIVVKPLCLKKERVRELEDHLLLFFTGIFRTAADVAKHQIENIPCIKRELGQMRDMVQEGANILCNSHDLADFGRLLHESWLIKRKVSDLITNQTIDDIYAKGLKAGAVGGKLLGAGGGGFILFYAPPEKHQAIKDALGLVHVPFNFEFGGSQIIFYEPETN